MLNNVESIGLLKLYRFCICRTYIHATYPFSGRSTARSWGRWLFGATCSICTQASLA